MKYQNCTNNTKYIYVNALDVEIEIVQLFNSLVYHDKYTYIIQFEFDC